MNQTVFQSSPVREPASEPVFVFGCRVKNDPLTEGAAAAAARFHGAIPSVWAGPNGNAYGVGCRGTQGQLLSHDALEGYIAEFIQYARNNPNRRFRIARFGCDKGEYDDVEMAELWRGLPKNCVLPALWQRAFGILNGVRILVFDPLDRLRSDEWRARFRDYIATSMPLWGVDTCTLISAMSAPRSTDSVGSLAKELGMLHREVRADPQYYGQQAPVVSEMLGVWHSTHLLCLTEPSQTAIPSHVRLLNYAERDGLCIDDLQASKS